MGDEAFGRQPVGTGAYKIKDWKADETVTLVAHDDYYRQRRAPASQYIKHPADCRGSSGC